MSDALPDRQTGLDAIARRDSASRFVYGVSTTGIVCRPACSARPKPDNIVLFASLAEALDAGYRPCRRCRPEADA